LQATPRRSDSPPSLRRHQRSGRPADAASAGARIAMLVRPQVRAEVRLTSLYSYERLLILALAFYDP
jgi:hypothetical protein